MFYFIYTIYLITIFTFCVTYEHSTHPIEPYHIKLVEEKVYAPFTCCNFTLKNPKLLINPYKKDIDNFVEPKPFGSMYLKCAACLSIADEIVKTIKYTMESIDEADDLEEIINKVADQLNILCMKGFKNFGLKKYNNGNVITNRIDCTDHVISSMDGNWTKKLREICALYVSYLNLNGIFTDVDGNIEDLPKRICSGGGIFRDCVNIPYENYSKILQEVNECY